MRFMIIRKADGETEAGTMPSEELVRQEEARNEFARAASLTRNLRERELLLARAAQSTIPERGSVP